MKLYVFLVFLILASPCTSSLLRACEQGDLWKIAIPLIHRQISPDIILNDQGFTPLHVSASHGHLQIVKFLLSKGANISITTTDGSSVVHYATNSGNVDLVRYLLFETKADFNATGHLGRNVLHIAAQIGNFDMVEMFTPGLDVDATDGAGNTALHIACAQGQFDIIRYLVNRYHANIDARNNDDRLPLEYAASHHQ